MILIKRLGNFIPQSPKDVSVMQRRLIRAGIRSEGALKLLYGAKAICGIGFPLLVTG
jgi:tight adherence protein C